MRYARQESRRRRVLVVEDSIDNAASTVLLIRGLGHDVEAALSGFSAMATARAFRPDVVLLDVGLPDTTGWEVARALKQEHASVRIIAITGRSGDENRARSMAAGCEQHLVRPLHPGVLEFLVAVH